MFNLLKSVLIHNHWQNRSFLMLEKSLVPVAQWAGAACFFSPREHLHSHSPLPGLIHPLFWISYCCFFRPITTLPLNTNHCHWGLYFRPNYSLAVCTSHHSPCARLQGRNSCRFIWTSLGAVSDILAETAFRTRAASCNLYVLVSTALGCSWWMALLSAAR